jgi:hypothetical protein
MEIKQWAILTTSLQATIFSKVTPELITLTPDLLGNRSSKSLTLRAVSPEIKDTRNLTSLKSGMKKVVRFLSLQVKLTPFKISLIHSNKM